MSRPLKITLIVILVVFPPAFLIPALPIFGPIYLWALQDLPPAESAVVATVYTIPLYLIAVALFIVWYRRRASRPRSRLHSPALVLEEHNVAELDERKRRKRHRQAEAVGDLLLTLELIDADKNRR
jgi:hypothetical protein